MIVYCPDKYKFQSMCDEAVDDSLAALKFIPDYFVTRKIKKLHTVLYTDDNVLYLLTKILLMPYFLVMK